MAFDLSNKKRREQEETIPSFLTFLLSCLSASRLPPRQCDLTREMPDAARAEAMATASPLMASALQDLPDGGMAGEGKLLNVIEERPVSFIPESCFIFVSMLTNRLSFSRFAQLTDLPPPAADPDAGGAGGGGGAGLPQGRHGVPHAGAPRPGPA